MVEHAKTSTMEGTRLWDVRVAAMQMGSLTEGIEMVGLTIAGTQRNHISGTGGEISLRRKHPQHQSEV